MRTGYSVIDAMSTRPVTVRPESTLQEAAALMHENDVGSLVVRREEQLLGILTEYDLVRKGVREALDMTRVNVADIMTRDLVTVSPKMDVFDALRVMMEADVRHLPVLDEGKLVGFLTVKDVLAIQPQLYELIVEKLATAQRRTRKEEFDEEFAEESF